MKRCCIYFVLNLLLLLVPTLVSAEQFTIEKDDDGVTVKLKGELFTRYLIKSGAKPILHPVIGIDGIAMTRNYPIAESDDTEKKDHPHHRSLWFTHGDVNGISFWHEENNHGDIVHASFEKVEGGDNATIVTKNNWLMPKEGKDANTKDAAREIVCTDRRVLKFGADKNNRWIDFDVELTAGEKPVVLGDTKEGTFGVRVAGTMKVTSELGGKIVSSEGLTNAKAWGKPAAWVDYHGPVGKKQQTYGVAIMNHPSSYGFPTHWHVRTYGLFAANPFGLHDFYGKESGKNGAVNLAPGESIKFRYRVLFHKGTEKEAKVAEAFNAYSSAE